MPETAVRKEVKNPEAAHNNLTAKIRKALNLMESVYTTKLSSRGQVVIPEEVRNRLGLKPGDQFVVVGKEDTVVLKSIAPPRLKDFESLIHTARAQAKTARLKRSDISKAITRVRRGK